MAVAQAAENHILNLILMMRDIHINFNLNPLTKFTTSRRSTEFKDILPLYISQMIMKTIVISPRIVISYEKKRAACFELNGKSIETETTKHDQNFPIEGKPL